MIVFDVGVLRSRLQPLSPASRCVFALLSSERWFPTLDELHGVAAGTAAHQLLEVLWAHVVGTRPLDAAEVKAAAEGADALIVTDDDLLARYGDDAGDPLPGAQSAIASLVYAATALSTGDVQEAVWAAQNSYDSADAYAQRALGPDAGDPALLGSAFVQDELGWQDADLRALSGPELDLDELRARNRARQVHLKVQDGQVPQGSSDGA